MNSEINLSKKLENTWNYSLMEILEHARLGDSATLDKYLSEMAPLAAVNSKYSVLLTLRHFDLSIHEEKRKVLNCHPKGENFQWGVTITTSSDSGNTQYNSLLPNNRNYSGVKINGSEIQIFMGDAEPLTTNTVELQRKLEFWSDFTEQELEDALLSLSNEKYGDDDELKLEVKNLLITVPAIGPLIYNEDFEWYEGIFTSGEIAFDVNIYNATPDKLDLLLSFVENQILTEYYKNILLEIEPELIKLKNQHWREVNEITTEKEPKITAEDFRKRVSIDSIIFNDDCSSQIYCHDDDIFWEHQIQINVDKNGKYKSVDLVG